MKAFFAVPAYAHAVATEFLMAALKTERLLVQANIDHEWSNRPGDQFIAKCRNAFVADFLADPDNTDLFFIDDDVAWEATKAVEFLIRPEPILAGVYPHKMDELSFPCVLEAGDGDVIERDSLVKALRVPAGFLRIKREVLQKLWDASPAYEEREANGELKERRVIFMAGPSIEDRQWWGEDYSFCNLAAEHGFEIWVDPDVPFHHRGQKRWTARLGDSLQHFRDKAAEMAPTRSAAA